MSLICPTSEDEIVMDKPRLHAFVIGVSDYPHLNNGTGRRALDPLGLSQVTTPHYTALAIVNWLLSEYKNPRCPLGSIEVVISPPATIATPNGGMQTESATKDQIAKAFAKWEQRCSAHRDNIAFFYFCGHGISKTEQYLLAEDFGDPTVPDEWQNCINFDRMRDGMRKCLAQTQLFFVDACRETPFNVLTQINVGGGGALQV